MKKLGSILSTAALIAAVATPTAAEAADSVRSCVPSGGKVVQSAGTTTVWQYLKGPLTACGAFGKPVELATGDTSNFFDSGSTSRLLALTDRCAAIYHESGNYRYEQVSGDVRIVDLAQRTAVSSSVFDLKPRVLAVTGVRLRPDCTAAFEITPLDGRAGLRSSFVFGLDVRGRREADNGSGIDEFAATLTGPVAGMQPAGAQSKPGIRLSSDPVLARTGGRTSLTLRYGRPGSGEYPQGITMLVAGQVVVVKNPPDFANTRNRRRIDVPVTAPAGKAFRVGRPVRVAVITCAYGCQTVKRTVTVRRAPAIAPAAGAATTGNCIPSGATALHRGAAETVSVYRYPGGPITACHGRKPAVQLGGWRDAPWPKHADTGPTTALRAVSGQCVATTQTEDGDYAQEEIQIADVQSRRRFTTAARYESERYYGSYVRLREVRLTSDCAAVLIYTAWDGYSKTRLPDPIQVIDASGSRPLPDGTDPEAALAGLEGRPVNTDLATPPAESRAKPVSGRPVLRATRNGAATLTLRLPPGTRGLTLHLAGRPVVVDQVKVRDKSLEWSTKPSAEPHTVELRVPGRADAPVRARARYRITTTVCTIGCRAQSWTAHARETAQPAS